MFMFLVLVRLVVEIILSVDHVNHCRLSLDVFPFGNGWAFEVRLSFVVQVSERPKDSLSTCHGGGVAIWKRVNVAVYYGKESIN